MYIDNIKADYSAFFIFTPKIQMAHFYQIVESKLEAYELENSVKMLLDKGWKLAGGVCVTIREVNGKKFPVYTQALTKDN